MNVTYTYQPTDWSYNLSSYSGNPAWFDRGFTGHEMLREFNLINMNARIYDPIIARMLQPDNYVQDGTFTQNYNRYSYVLNNPLAFIDADGNNPLLLIAGFVLLGGYLGGVLTNHGELNPIQWNWTGPDAWKTYTGILGGGIVGGIAGWGVSGLIAGTVSVSVAATTPAGGSILLYNSTSGFSNLQWTSTEGGPSIDWSGVDATRINLQAEEYYKRKFENNYASEKNTNTPGVYNITDFIEAKKYGIPTPPPYVSNYSNLPVYVKPENTSEALFIGPRQLYIYRVDGINTLSSGVYKVPDYVRINVDTYGHINTYGFFSSVHYFLGSDMGHKNHDWLKRQQASNDHGWDALFNIKW